MTKLEAVRLIFSLCGKLPPPALDTGKSSMAGLAEDALDSVEQEIQSEGWHPNREEKIELSPGGDGKIAVPADALEIDSDDTDRWRNVTQRGGFLFDLDKNTCTFNHSIRVKLTRRLAFTDLPDALARYIATEAAVRFNRQHNRENGKEIHRDLVGQAELARRKALVANNRTKDVNVLESAHALNVKGRIRRRY